MTTESSRAGRGRGCLGCLSVAVILAILLGIAFTLWRRTEEDGLRERFAERGLPASLQELDAWYAAVPADQNAALGFVAAADAMIVGPVDKPIPIFASNVMSEAPFPMDDATIVAVSEYLSMDENVEALSLANDASKLPGSRYPVDLSIAPMTNLDHLSTMRSLARLLWVDALAAAQAGQPAHAVESFRVVDALARSLSREPLLISQLVSFAIAQGNADRICDALSVTAFSRKDLDAIARMTEWPDAADAYYRGIAGESVLGLFGMTQANGPLRFVLTFDRFRYARFIETLLETSDLPLAEAAALVEAMAVQSSQTAQRWFPISSSVQPSMARSHRAFVRSEVQRELLRIIVAVEKYRLDNNAIPNELSQLVPAYLAELPQDPYGNGAYVYLREGPGYAVYSVGPNRTDDRAAKLTGTSGDIHLRVTR